MTFQNYSLQLPKGIFGRLLYTKVVKHTMNVPNDAVICEAKEGPTDCIDIIYRHDQPKTGTRKITLLLVLGGYEVPSVSVRYLGSTRTIAILECLTSEPGVAESLKDIQEL